MELHLEAEVDGEEEEGGRDHMHRNHHHISGSTITVPIADGPISAVLVHVLDLLQVFFREGVRRLGLAHEERVMCVAGRVLLRLEERVEVPERGLDVLVGWHLVEPHLQEDLPELLLDFEQWVQRTGGDLGCAECQTSG